LAFKQRAPLAWANFPAHGCSEKKKKKKKKKKGGKKKKKKKKKQADFSEA